MDEQRFDHLSRRLAGFRNRRQAIKAIAGAAVGLVAGSRAASATSPCSTPYASCQSDGQCCPGAVCEYGMCMPGCRIDGAFYSAWMSPPENICAQCLPERSTTSWTPANEGMSCWSGDPNAGVTTCQSGTCAPLSASCSPPTPCHLEGEIDPATGLCVNPPAPEGTFCGNGPMCYGGFYQPADACDGNGFCIGGGSQTVNCAPYQCGDGACSTTCSGDGDCLNGTVCCNGACVYLDTIDHCGRCDVSCGRVDACTPAECVNGSCVETSICTPVDACTPADCLDNGSCNEVSACSGFNTCGGGGVTGQCGCTPSNPICQAACNEANGCGGTCTGRPATTPALSITFAPTGDANFCLPTAHLSGFAGCTTYPVEYWSARSADGTVNLQRSPNFNATTDPTGSSHTPTGSFFNQNRWIEFRIGAVRSGWQQVVCPPA